MAMGKLVVLALVAMAAVPAAAKDGGTSVAAVQKVIQMLQEMSAKCKSEKNDEEVAYAKFEQFCTMDQAKLKKYIAAGEKEAESLTASIAQLTADAKTLGEDIEKLQSDVASYQAQKKATEEQRRRNHEAFLAEQRDYDESVSALNRAISVLSDQNYDRTGLLQKRHRQEVEQILLQISDKESLVPQARAMAAAMLQAFTDDPEDDDPEARTLRISLQQAGSPEDYAAPEANAYEFQSNGIIEVLKNLQTDFSRKLAECQKEEMNSKHAANMMVTDLVDSIENAEDDIAGRSKTKSSKEAQCAQDKRSLASCLSSLADDRKALAEFEAECSEKGLSFQEKQRLRAQEIEAIEQAIEVLSGESVSGAAEKHLNLAQRTRITSSFLQFGRTQVHSQGISIRLRDFLATEGQKLHSKKLSMLSAQVGAADIFGKVKKLIDDMITRLLEEANADAEKEGWCDNEIGRSKVTRNKLQESIDGLTAEVEEGKANIAQLTEDIATLATEVADMQASMTEATTMREEESAKNKQSVAESTQAQNAVSNAISILKAFYEKAALATGFLQFPHMGSDEWNALANPNYEGTADTVSEVEGFGVLKTDKGHKAGMQTFGEKYSGMQDEAGGVLALLDAVLSDFANVEADTKAAEVQAQNTYEEFMTDSKRSVAMKTKKSEMCSSDKVAAATKLSDDTKELKANQDELLAADRYYDKLAPQCLQAGVTYDDRVKQRESEIASLKEALAILSNEDITTSA